MVTIDSLAQTVKQENEKLLPLQARGILNVAIAAGWQPRFWNGRDGWQYPVCDYDGKVIALRWKAAPNQGDGFKYSWIPSKPKHDLADWYILPGTADAITKNHGVCYLANGEPSMLAYHAAGVHNVIATTAGENTVPANTIDVLQKLGVHRLLYPADKDQAGMNSAVKWREALRGSGIDYQALQWSDLVPDKGDANDLWIALEFDQILFRATLHNLSPLDLPAVKEQPKQEYTGAYTDECPADVRAEILRQIERQRGFTGYRSDGQTKTNIAGFGREDKHPSATFNCSSMLYFDHATGEGMNWVSLAKYLDIPINNAHYSQKSKPKTSTKTPLKNAPESESAYTPETFTANQKVNVQYVSEIMPLIKQHKTVALKSAIATGKTELIIRMIKSGEVTGRVLYITHLESLNTNAAERFNAAEIQFEAYNNIPASISLNGIKYLTCSLNSIHRLSDTQKFDLVVFDEINQALPIFWSPVMSGEEPARNYNILKALLRNANRVIALDAQLSDIAANWLHGIRNECTRIENTFTPKRNKLKFHKSEYSVLASAVECARNNPDRCTVIATGIKSNGAKLYEKMFAAEFGKSNVLTIHGDNSQNSVIRSLINDLDKTINDYRVLIVSPSIGTGFDLQTPVAGVFGIYSNGIKVPAGNGIIQHMMRFRNAGERHIYVPNHEYKLITDADLLYSQYATNAQKTFDAVGATGEVITSTQDELTRLYSQFTAAENRQKLNLMQSVMALARCEGFIPIIAGIHKNSELIKQQKNTTRDDLSQWRREQRLIQAAISQAELQKKQQNGTITELDYIAYERNQIELATLEEITPEANNFLSNRQKRKAYENFRDWHIQAENELHAKDREELKRLPMKRKHHTRNRRLFEAALVAMFGNRKLRNDDYIPVDEFEARARKFVQDNSSEIVHLDGRNDLSENPIAVVRRLFKNRNAVVIGSKQIRIDGKLVRHYYIDREEFNRLMRFVRGFIANSWLFQNAEIPKKELTLRVLKQLAASGSGNGPDPVPDTGAYALWQQKLDEIPI